jgi:glucosamine--fructose-6-phosphate aminotransferase (isomerizing)
MREMVEKLRSLKAETVVISDESNRDMTGSATRSIRLASRLRELYTPIPYIIPAQLFAACLASQKGLDPDKPRTLTKVTRTL